MDVSQSLNLPLRASISSDSHESSPIQGESLYHTPCGSMIGFVSVSSHLRRRGDHSGPAPQVIKQHMGDSISLVRSHTYIHGFMYTLLTLRTHLVVVPCSAKDIRDIPKCF